MLSLRTVQLTTLAGSRIRAFEDRTCAHLQRYFPRHYLLLGDEPMRTVVRQGWQKAGTYGLTAECCVRSYIEFMCRLGSGFDTDPLLPWAARILNDKAAFGEIERGDRLYHQAWNYIDHISRDYRDNAGQPTTARFMGEFRGLRHGRDDILTENSYPEFASELTWQIETNFPAKCAYVGRERWLGVIPQGVRSARAFGITTERGTALFTILRFVLGEGFAHDPLLPWASNILNDRAITNQTEKIDRLYAEGLGFLKRWWDSAPEEAG